MRRPFGIARIVLSVLALSPAGYGRDNRQTSGEVFFDAKMHQVAYAGPGREEPDPTDIDEVLIGYFGPADPCHPAYDMWSAACLAVEQANSGGGYKGLPFRLVQGWSDNPWGTGVREVVRMAYLDKVWANAPDLPFQLRHDPAPVAVAKHDDTVTDFGRLRDVPKDPHPGIGFLCEGGAGEIILA